MNKCLMAIMVCSVVFALGGCNRWRNRYTYHPTGPYQPVMVHPIEMQQESASSGLKYIPSTTEQEGHVYDIPQVVHQNYQKAKTAGTK